MKQVFLRFFICLITATLFVGTAVVCTADPVDTAMESSLTLQYKHGGEVFSGLEIQSYRIAEASADGTYSLCGAFENYPVDIYGVESQAEWQNIASTLAVYAVADRITPDCTAVTDDTGTVSFEKILPGMYLTLSVRSESEGEVTVFETFLTAVPHPDGDRYNYDVTAYPKCSSYTPAPVDIQYKVVKQWKEGVRNDARPASVTVDILRDGEVFYTEILSAENDWSYSWSAPDDGAIWQTVEREVPKDYTVTVIRDGDTFIITNIYGYGTDKAPQTGKITVMWPYALAMALSGGAFIILAIWRRRREA